MTLWKKITLQALCLLFLLTGCNPSQEAETPAASARQAENTDVSVVRQTEESSDAKASAEEKSEYSIRTVPEFSGKPFVTLHQNKPSFSEEDYTTQAFESYQQQDELGRCGCAYACVGTETMPTENRGSIGMIKPSGWKTVRYDLIDGKYLYNRCHLIGYQLTAENANEKNLITGTRYLNVEGMLPFENMVADYIKETNNHVLYRVTPIFHERELVARGVEMEAFSVEDRGSGICFHIYAYNVQPDIVIDYATGDSHMTVEGNDKVERDYVLNTNRKTFHLPDCPSVSSIKEKNKTRQTTTAKQLKQKGYKPCGNCISE